MARRTLEPGEIALIKWVEIEPATDDVLDAFLASQVEDEVPEQLPDATRFVIDADGRVSVEPDPPIATPAENPEQVAIYVELREKTTDLMGAGSNMLGHLWAPLGAFQDVLPPNLADASITRIWLRANKLRSVLRAHDHIKDVPEGGHPAEIDPACAEHLRDVVETINVFILGDSKGSELDQNRLGPSDRAEAAELLLPFFLGQPVGWPIFCAVPCA